MSQDVSTLLPDWEVSMKSGFYGGRPFGPETVSIYQLYIKNFLKDYGEISVKALRFCLAMIPAERFGKRDKFFKSVICFTKFLVDEGHLPADVLFQMQKYRPKRVVPPKKTRIKADEVMALLERCKNQSERVAILLMVTTGIRAGELCKLTWEDIDLNKAEIYIRKRKWGKDVKLGIPSITIQALRDLDSSRGLVLEGRSRYALYHMIRRLGLKSGIKAHPHAFRAAFVTIALSSGKPISDVQVACSHSKMATTQIYNHTDDDERVERMKGWNILPASQS